MCIRDRYSAGLIKSFIPASIIIKFLLEVFFMYKILLTSIAVFPIIYLPGSNIILQLNLSTNFLLYVGNNKNNKTGGGVIIDRDDVRLFPERYSSTQSDYDFEIFRGKPGFEVKIDYLDDHGNLVSNIVGYGQKKVDPPLAKDKGGFYEEKTVRRKRM